MHRISKHYIIKAADRYNKQLNRKKLCLNMCKNTALISRASALFCFYYKMKNKNDGLKGEKYQ